MPPVSPCPRTARAHPRRPTRLLLTAALCGLATFGLASMARAETLTLYSGQHEQTVDQLVSMFETSSGVSVKVHSGEGPELANQLIAEGASSPADVYFTENSPELQLLAEKGLLAPVDKALLAEVPAADSSPRGLWLGVLARESVLAYNTGMVQGGALPPSVLDLGGPAWKGKVAIAPTDADFLPLVSAVAAVKGQAVALQWLRGLEENAQTFDDDEGVVAAVDRGVIAVGLINNYYWERLRQQNGAAAMHSAIHHFAAGDPGAVVNISGAAVMKSSHHADAARRFLAFLVSEPAQTALGHNAITFEYPLRPGVAADPALRPLDQLHPPQISMEQLGDDSGAAALLRQAGLL